MGVLSRPTLVSRWLQLRVLAVSPMRLQTASTGLGLRRELFFLKLTPMVRFETAPTLGCAKRAYIFGIYYKRFFN